MPRRTDGGATDHEPNLGLYIQLSGFCNLISGLATIHGNDTKYRGTQKRFRDIEKRLACLFKSLILLLQRSSLYNSLQLIVVEISRMTENEPGLKGWLQAFAQRP